MTIWRRVEGCHCERPLLGRRAVPACTAVISAETAQKKKKSRRVTVTAEKKKIRRRNT